MATQCWWRNPRLYIRELAEVGVGNIIFDQGVITKHRMNALDYVHAHFGQAIPYRLIILGHMTAAEYSHEHGPKKPIAVYPAWQYGEDADILEEFLASPVGEDKDVCFDLDTPADQRPVWGQEHRVIVTNIPNNIKAIGRRFLVFLKDMQEKYPNAILHLHGAFSYKVAFGHGYGAADVSPRDWAAHGQVALPTGSVVNVDVLQKHATWVTAMGFTPAELSVPRNRCIYNIKSGEWASKNFMELTPVRTTRTRNPDTTTPAAKYEPKSGRILHTNLKGEDSDKILCNMCSLALKCSYFRDGAVCSLPDAEPTSLAKFFQTRDSDSIIDGLSTLVAFNARRLERGARTEEALDDLDPEITKLATTVFEQGVKLAKLIDPKLRSAAVKVNINGSENRVAVAGATPQELTGGIIRALEQQGIPRDQITPQMVRGMLEGMANPQKAQAAIEGETVNRDESQ